VEVVVAVADETAVAAAVDAYALILIGRVDGREAGSVVFIAVIPVTAVVVAVVNASAAHNKLLYNNFRF